MERKVGKHNHTATTNNTKFPTAGSLRDRTAVAKGNCFLNSQSSETDFVLRWGNRKRLRCMKMQPKDDPTQIQKPTSRRVVRASTGTNGNIGHQMEGLNHCHFNLRQRPASPARVNAASHRVLRNADGGSCLVPNMKGVNNGHGGVRRLSSPDRSHHDGKKGGGQENGSGRNMSSDLATKKSGSGGGGSSSGGEGIPSIWPPKFMIALTNKEKEEDFMAIKGSKLPQRPKKRAKFTQRTVNLVSPGGWLCDLTLERYEVREKKVSKKRPRGLKAMGNMDSDSE